MFDTILDASIFFNQEFWDIIFEALFLPIQLKFYTKEFNSYFISVLINENYFSLWYF